MGVQAESPDHSTVATPPDQSFVDFLSPLTRSSFRRVRRNNYVTPDTSRIGDISRLARNIDDFDLETDMEIIRNSGVTIEQMEQRHQAMKHLERTPKPRRPHIKADGTLIYSKRPRDDPESDGEDILKDSIKPKKPCQDKYDNILDLSESANISNSKLDLGSVAKEEYFSVLDAISDTSISSLLDPKELES